MTDGELDGYLVLVLFMLKNKKSGTSKKSEKFWVREYSKRDQCTDLATTLNWG